MEQTIPINGAPPLLDIHEVPRLNDDDLKVMNEVAAVLRQHNALDRFGLMLLHQHFDIAPDEVLLEECDPVTRTLTIKPTNTASLREVAFRHTSWRLDTAGPVMHCACRVDPDDGNHNHYHVR